MSDVESVLEVPSRFKQKYAVDKNGCWVWNAGKSGDGYGVFWYEGTCTSAHIASYKMHVGPVPAGKELDHLCSVFACVNPAHLEPVTHAENLRRAYERKPKPGRTKCKAGHEMTGDNLGIWGDMRYCKACNKRRSLEYYHKKKAKNV